MGNSAPSRLDVDLARLCLMAYSDPQAWPDWSRALYYRGWTMEHSFDEGPAQGYLFRHVPYDPCDPAVAAIVFRGTQVTENPSLLDLLSNLSLGAHPWDGPGRAHAGYAAHFSMIRDVARDAAEKVDPAVPLVVAGHSLGGALATLYAAWCDHRLARLVTFGAPKAVNKEAARHVLATCAVDRYVVRGDFAPSWPPSWTLTHPAPANFIKVGPCGMFQKHAPTSYVMGMMGANLKGYRLAG